MQQVVGAAQAPARVVAFIAREIPRSDGPVHSPTAMNAHRSLPFALAVCALSCSHAAAPPEAPSTAAQTPVAAPPATRPSVLEPGAVRGAVTAPRGPSNAGVTHVGATPPPPVARPAASLDDVRVTVSRVTAAEGEDGHGNTVRATNPVAIDLERATGWQGGALTTTLHVGALSFHFMGYPEVTTMRFIVADGRALPTRGEVSLQYGPDPERRRVIAAALPVIP